MQTYLFTKKKGIIHNINSDKSAKNKKKVEKNKDYPQDYPQSVHNLG